MIKKILVIIIFVLMVFTFNYPANADEVKDDDNPLYKRYEKNSFSDPEFVEKWDYEMIKFANSRPTVGDWKVNNLYSESNDNHLRSSSQGSWSWRDGVICIRDSYAFLPNYDNGHAGIVGVAPNYYCVIEANPGTGVSNVYGAWHTNNSSANVYQVGVTNTTVAQDAEAAEWANDQIGKSYGNPLVTPIDNTTVFYCSQLVYAAYKYTCNVDLDTPLYTIYTDPYYDIGFKIIHPYEILNNYQVTRIFTYNPD